MPKTPKIYKTIPVSPETYEKVKLIAKAGGYTMGGLVMIWARKCTHPAGQRVLLGRTTVHYPPDGKVSAPVQIWQCRDCGRIMVLPADGFDADGRSLAMAVTPVPAAHVQAAETEEP